MTPIKGFNGYYVQGSQVIGRHKHPLKPDKRNIIAMYDNDGKLYRGELYKIIWSAMNDIDVRDVPKQYSFREENGTIIVEAFSDRMSNVRKQYYNTVKAKYDDYVFIADYAEIAKQMLNHYPDSRLRLFHLLNSKRDECVKYARYASGGVSQEKAETYTDQAIIKVFETICKGLYAVPSPIASIKWHINHAIRMGRRKRELNYQKDMTKKIFMMFILLTSIICCNAQTIAEVRNELHKQGIPHADIVLAQARLETGNFTSVRCKRDHNIFGIKHGRRYARYNNWRESVADYKKRISSRYTGGDYYAFLRKIGYARDARYTNKVSNIVRTSKQ